MKQNEFASFPFPAIDWIEDDPSEAARFGRASVVYGGRVRASIQSATPDTGSPSGHGLTLRARGYPGVQVGRRLSLLPMLPFIFTPHLNKKGFIYQIM